MNQNRWSSFIVLNIVLVLVIQLLVINWVMAQAPNITLSQNPNNTKLIVNMKNHTITLVDKRTNETIGVMELKLKAGANNTTNETLTTNEGNTTNNETLTPEKTKFNENVTTNIENATTNESLTSKFNDLQGK